MLLIYSPDISPRFNYVISWVFDQLGIQWQVSPRLVDFEKHAGPRISYSKENLFGLCVTPSGLLSSDLIELKKPDCTRLGNMPVLFGNNSEFGFDIFSAVFYMLSRYEEYLPFSPDIHNRFPSSESLAFQNDFIGLPVCDIWIEYLRENLRKKYPDIIFATRPASSILTYDIDVAYKFIGKSWLRQIGSTVKDIFFFRIKNLKDRLGVLTDKRNDPWDLYEFLKTESEKIGADCIFFFAAGQRSKYDRNPGIFHSSVKALLNHLKQFARIGIHPSYFSCEKEELISLEKMKLEKASALKVLCSRQHFLRFKLPDTYLWLMKAGVTEDFSMAFPDCPGFRAGTVHPFCFYDLKNEIKSDLMIHPSGFMDHTCIQYLHLSPDESWDILKKYIDITFHYNGEFIPIFHNDHLSKFEWRDIHSKMTSYLQEIQTGK